MDDAAGIGDRSPGQLQSASVRSLQRPGINERFAAVVRDDQWRRLIGVDRRLVGKGVPRADSTAATDPPDPRMVIWLVKDAPGLG